ncbi:Cell division protein BolA [hydrothermal vent metagenome]|uniref:Cell division protein BolA n=1 Tax=hydrothermal vent metagenome TaxID=652676 RepID=A0A3B0TY36_9ZZZZ
MSVSETIKQKLTRSFSPDILEVEDISEQHRGHANWREGGNTHFRIKIATSHFASLTRVAQHRAVMEVLKDEFKAGVHALTIEIINS